MAMSDNDKSGAEERLVLSTERARQGVTGHHVLSVLTVGTISVIVLFAIVYMIFFR